MLTFRRHDEPAEHPWQQGHAAPEDRAVGLELQLIELTHQRDTVDQDHARAMAAEIDEVLTELAEVDQQVPLAS